MRFARRERISSKSLMDAVARVERGLIDADLGGGVIKQRIARTGQGKSGGFRVLLAFRARERVIFLYGFAKSERENIASDELATLRELAQVWLAADAVKIAKAIAEQILIEVKDED